MAQSDKTRQLSIEQENAIDFLVAGKSEKEVAFAVNVNRSTLNKWRHHDAVFVAALNARRQEIWGSQSERLLNLVSKAVDVLEEGLNAFDEKVRLNAAIHLLKAVKLYGTSQYPQGSTDPSIVESQWENAKRMERLLSF
jgi:hypothetical protein